MSIFLSIVIPAYNEEARLPATLERIFTYLSLQSYAAEVIVVENGSTDRTSAVVQQLQPNYPQLILIEEQLRGKGIAVRRGMLAARGAYRFLCDADLSMPIEEISRFLPPNLGSFEIAIASRELPGAVRYGEPPFRHFIGRIFNYIVRLLAVPGFQDTQCGFKCFQDTAAKRLFAQQQLDGWGFDVEVLFLALKYGVRVREIPIPWYFDPDSRIKPWRDSVTMLRDILAIRQNWRRGAYADPG